MASSQSKKCDLTNSNWVFLNLAMQLDSSLHPEIQHQLKNVNLVNTCFAVTGREELIPVGSCMDGSKVNTPTDYGDIDILLVPRKHVLDEKLFDYDPHYPAFLHVKGEKDHAKIFTNVKLVDGYVPVMVLKQMQRHCFHLVSLYIYATMSSDVRSKKHRSVNVTKRSGVGLEFATLDLDNFDLKGAGQKWKGVDKLRILRKFIDSTMDVLIGYTDNPKEGKHKEVDSCSGKLKAEQSYRTSTSSCNSEILPVEYEEIDPEDGEVTMRYNNNLDIDESDESCEVNYDSKASMPVANTSNFDDGDSDDQTVSLPKTFSADFVPAFQFNDWPRPAAEWKTRKRLWPSKETVKKVVECGCHIVSKRPLFSDLKGDPANEDNSPESDKTNNIFRLSFSRCELLLANSLTETQKYCWRVLKAYQKAFLGTEPKVLASYHWKNVVFWVSEETDHSFWTEDNLLFGVCKALDFMITCLRQKNVPVYFVRNENLIAGCRHEVIDQALERVIWIRNNPIGKLQLFLENPPLSPLYRVRRTTLTASSEDINTLFKYIKDVVADLVRQLPETAMDEDFLSRIPCRVLEFWQVLKTRIEENVTSNKWSVYLENVDIFIKQNADKLDFKNKTSEVSDRISKTVLETALHITVFILHKIANKTEPDEKIVQEAFEAVVEIVTSCFAGKPVDRNKVIGCLLYALRANIDDRMQSKPSFGSTFLLGACLVLENFFENVMKGSEK